MGPSSAAAPSMGRITGSASIETLVRVGIEKENGLGPEAKMVVLHDFTPCVDDELEVKRGQVRLGVVHTNNKKNSTVSIVEKVCWRPYGSRIGKKVLITLKKTFSPTPGITCPTRHVKMLSVKAYALGLVLTFTSAWCSSLLTKCTK